LCIALGVVLTTQAPSLLAQEARERTAGELMDAVMWGKEPIGGLTGSAAQIRKAASGYRAYFAKVAISGGNEYTVDHSSFIYLMDRGGKYLGFFPPGTSAEQMAQVIRPHLSAPEPR
jgi:cytochrome oxidase Cu insertion factor (SCO1/SenC/PrrC family)